MRVYIIDVVDTDGGTTLACVSEEEGGYAGSRWPDWMGAEEMVKGHFRYVMSARGVTHGRANTSLYHNSKYEITSADVWRTA